MAFLRNLVTSFGNPFRAYRRTRREERQDDLAEQNRRSNIASNVVAGESPLTYLQFVDQYGISEGGIRFTAQEEKSKTRAEARSKIKPIADPKEDQAERRKRAARRRRGGRLGTILTGETLG